MTRHLRVGRALRSVRPSPVLSATAIELMDSPSLHEDPVDISIVIPIYNEEGILSASVADLTEKLQQDPRWSYTYELILSENGSTDTTVEVARR